EVAVAGSSARDERRIVAVRGARRRILVVDDKADNRQLMRDLLAPLSFEIEEAEDGDACLARVSATPHDAVLLDLRMPGLSGLEVLQRLRASHAGSRLVVIAVSASVFGHHREECIAAGADDFLPKPFRVERLLDLLCRHLGLEAIHAEAEEERAADLIFPPADVLTQLLAQARRGDIKQVLERAGRVEASDARYRPFVRELQELAGRFQVKRLCQFLEDGGPSR
ncbi:MAG: serine/threonine protein kinase, partial [Candidatus Rokuibacteriota bacterium]